MGYTTYVYSVGYQCMGAADPSVGGVAQRARHELTWSLNLSNLFEWCSKFLLLLDHSKSSSTSTNRCESSLGPFLATHPVQASRRFPQRDRVLSFEPPSTSDDLSSRLDRILGLRLDLLRLTLEHVSLDDFKPEYTTFRTAHLAQWGRSQVDNAWCEQFDFELGSTSSEMFPTIARLTWGDYTAISYMWGSPEDTKTITINGILITVGKNLAAALDRLRYSLVDNVWIDATCINQDDIDERNAQILRIRDIFSQSLAVTVWLGEHEMSGTGLESWVKTSFDNLRLCNTILKAHGRRTLEAALEIDVKAWELDHDYDELEGLPLSGDVLYFDNEWWADSDNEDEFGPSHFRDLIAKSTLSPLWKSILDWPVDNSGTGCQPNPFDPRLGRFKHTPSCSFSACGYLLQ